MSYRDKIKNLLSESESPFFLEVHDFANYARLQGAWVIPLLAAATNMTSSEFQKRPDVEKFYKAFRTASVERFGKDEKMSISKNPNSPPPEPSPNTSDADDPRWNLKHPESDILAQELVRRVLEIVKNS